MWYYPASGLINGLTLTILGIFVFLRNRKALPNITYVIFCFFISFWSYSYFLWQISKTSKEAFFWCQMLMLGAVFIPAAYFHFITTLINRYTEKSMKQLIYFAYLLAGIFAILNFTPLMIIDVRSRLKFPFWPTAGPAYKYFLMYFAVYSIYGCYLLLKEARKASGIKRNQFIYVFIGSTLGYIGGATNFPLWYDIKLYPVGNILSSIYVAMIGYAIIKYRLMDIKLVWRQVLIFSGYLIIACGLPALVIFFTYKHPLFLGVIMALLLLVCPFLYRYLQRFSQPFVDKVVLGGKYNYWQEFDKLKEADLGYFPIQIAWNLVKIVVEILQVETASFFMLVKNRKEFRPQAQIGLDDEIGVEPIPWVTLSLDSPLIRHFSNSKEPLIKNELTRESSGSNSVAQEMQRLYAEVSIPLFVRGELIGILNLGPKVTQEMYHGEDIQKLTAFCQQAENHLSHATFMEERASFSQDLAHDMKNLFTKAIAPTVETILETKDPSRKDQEFKTLVRQLGYLNQRLIENFDLVSFVVKVIYGKYPLEPGHIAKVVSQSASLYQPSLREKGLSLELELPKDLPLVLMNKDDLPKVFNNLLDNSLKFTPKGGKILIKAETKEDEVLVTFSDTGLGIAKEDLEHLFEPKLKMPEETETGTGLGLVIVRDIIEAHKGSIRVESETGKGTTFHFTLSIAKEEKGETRNERANISNR